MAHNAFVNRLNEINLDDMDDNQKEYLDELLQFLLSWLSNHILKMDKQIPAQMWKTKNNKVNNWKTEPMYVILD